jgi:putative flavoprotein involved in K+ transport
MLRLQPEVQARGFTIAKNRTAPRRVRRLGIDVIEALFDFETAVGRGSGVLRLPADKPSQAWVFSTSLEELKGFEEKVGTRRPTGEEWAHNFGGDNWLDQRTKRQAYVDRDPTVLVVGAGQAGLAIAARLGQLNVDTLVVDKHERIGDNWRKRYHSLALHNQIQVNHLPYMPFPPTWPKYIPKDMLANWFETYAWSLQLNVWTSTEFTGATFDEAAGCWKAVVRKADGSERTLSPRHLIFANGVSGLPRIPSLPGLDEFAGQVVHSHSFTDGSPWRGKKVLVLGTGNSGHDIAQELHSHGADTTIIQRGSTTVVTVDPSAKLNYALYDEGPLEDCDLLASANTYPLVVRGYQLAVERMVEFDKEMIAGLIARGFKYDIGEDKTGHQMKYRRRGGGYYLDVGCSGLIISGAIRLLQFDQIERFVAEGALLKDGSVRPADLLVLATGYYSQQDLVRRLLGDAVADRVGQIWGFDADGELANMWKRTPQPGLWFNAGGLGQCRIYSKYLALQIKAIEEGLIPR